MLSHPQLPEPLNVPNPLHAGPDTFEGFQVRAVIVYRNLMDREEVGDYFQPDVNRGHDTNGRIVLRSCFAVYGKRPRPNGMGTTLEHISDHDKLDDALGLLRALGVLDNEPLRALGVLLKEGKAMDVWYDALDNDDLPAAAHIDTIQEGMNKVGEALAAIPASN